MAVVQNKDAITEFQLRGIELLKGSLGMPLNVQPVLTFNFDIKIESRIDPSNKLIFVIVMVDIKNDDQTAILGNLAVSCIYHIRNFDEVIKLNEATPSIPQLLADTLNSISLSTTRGVMFSTFKGTFLHNAILPIVDPKKFSDVIPKKE